MTKYSKFNSQASMGNRPYEIHPIWRGIGCLTLLIGPLVAFAAAHLLVDMNSEQNWYPVPAQMTGSFTIPEINYTITHFYADLLLAGVLLVLGFGVIMVVYTAIYSMMGPRRYGPLDAPPEYRRPKKRR